MDRSLLQDKQRNFSMVFINSCCYLCGVKSWSLGLLGQSRFSGDIPHIVKCFDKTTKLRFRNANEPQYIRFGGSRDKDLNLNIRAGQLKLLGYASNIISQPRMRYIFFRTDVASFFEPSVQCIVKSIKEQCETSDTEISVRSFSRLRLCV